MERVRTDCLTRSQQAFFELLRSGLWGTTPAASCFPLTSGEWQQVYDEACRQTVQGIVYDALQRLPDDLVPPMAFTLQWTSDVAAIMVSHRSMQRAVVATYNLLRQAGAEPVLMKGLASAHCYEKPQLRVNGDIDWYLPANILGTLPNVLERQGIPSERHADGSLCFSYDGTEVELHPRLADLLWPGHQKTIYNMNVREGFATLPVAPPGETSTDVPTSGAVVTLLIHVSHIFKHTASVGIGLRQFCDLARACHHLSGHYDPALLTTALRDTGLLRWSRLLQLFLSRHLGLDATLLSDDASASDADCDRLLHLTLSGGNFGQHNAQWQQAHQRGRNRLHTLRSLCSHAPFALRYAPKETLSLLFSLAKGQKNIQN